MYPVLASGFLLLIGLFPLSDAAVNASPRIPPAGKEHSLFDSIRTDLSDYIWPTDASRQITSSFGDYRRTHFHAGIDIRTHDQTGYRVFASRDGYVARIRISPTGYGKMLYVRHNDGYTTTYAHLEKFAGAIEERAVGEQRRLQQYPVDIRCVANELPVRKGETIAYTGETGTGAPHLHFEVRDENMNPVNPFLCPGLRIEDSIPPEIIRVELVPLSADAEVNSRPEPAILRVFQTDRSHARIQGHIMVSGRVGVAVDVRDRSNGSWYRHAAYGHDLFLDDHLLYSVRLNRVSAARDQESGLYYDWDMEEDHRERFERLYLPFAVLLPVVNGVFGGDGVIPDTLRHGRHTLRIVSLDFAGNFSEVITSIITSPRPRVSVRVDSLGPVLTSDGLDTLARVTVKMRDAATGNWRAKELVPPAAYAGHEWRVPVTTGGSDIVSIVAENRWGFQSRPMFLVLHTPRDSSSGMTLTHECVGDYVRMSIVSRGIFTSPPEIFVYEGGARREFPSEAIDLHHYTSSFYPDAECAGLRRVVTLANVGGRSVEARDEFDLYPVVPGQRSSVTADNGNLRIGIDSAAVPFNIFLHVEKESDGDGTTYSLLPTNTVLQGTMTVSLPDRPALSRTGIFFRGGRAGGSSHHLPPKHPGSLRHASGALWATSPFFQTLFHPGRAPSRSVRAVHGDR